jgi:hypothetical protein
MPRLISRFCWLMPRTTTSTWSPACTTSLGWLMRRVQLISETWTLALDARLQLTKAP